MFLQALSAREGAARYVEAFAFGTRLTRLTPHLLRPRSGCGADAGQPALADWGGRHPHRRVAAPPTTACSAGAA